jgi:hypothetical protein
MRLGIYLFWSASYGTLVTQKTHITSSLKTDSHSAFVERFGTYNETTKKYAIAAYLTSILNSFPYLGKLIVRPRTILINITVNCVG